jgi:hypothetical protein
MIELLIKTGELLVWSFWNLIVPAATWFWRYIIVLVGWLVVGGLFVAPLIAAGARRLYHRFKRWPVRALICIIAILLIWIWVHIWTASALMWQEAVGFSPPLSPDGWLLVGVALSALGLWFWWRKPPVGAPQDY